MSAVIEARIAGLAELDGPALRDLWRREVSGPVPRISPKLLRLALAWEIQATAFGGLPRKVRQTLEQVASGKTQTAPARAGTRLVREWNGVAHVVTIGEDQAIRWNERNWNSLSEVARAITGTRWSGPAFFGLKKRVGQ